MPTFVRSALAGACLFGMFAGEASALQCIRPEMTEAILLKWAQHVAYAIEGPSVESPDGQECTFEGKVITPVKGALTAGQTFIATYDGWDGCMGGSKKPVLGQYFGGADGKYSIPLCNFAIDYSIVDAYLKQKNALEATARKMPGNVEAQLALAGFYTGWSDVFQAGPAADEALKLAPASAEAQLSKARADLLSAGSDTARYTKILKQFAGLQSDLPLARVLRERTQRTIDRLAMRGPDGNIPEGATLPPFTLTGIDLTGLDLTGFWLDGIVLEGLVAPRSDWTVSDLSDDNLSKADLTGAIFTQALLARTDFRAARLQGAKFAGALLVDADFSGAEMQLANLREIRAEGAKFIGTDLRGAVLTEGWRSNGFAGTDFTNADLRGADIRELTGAEITWTGARYDCQTRFPRGFQPEKHGMVFADKSVCIGGAQAGK